MPALSKHSENDGNIPNDTRQFIGVPPHQICDSVSIKINNNSNMVTE